MATKLIVAVTDLAVTRAIGVLVTWKLAWGCPNVIQSLCIYSFMIIACIFAVQVNFSCHHRAVSWSLVSTRVRTTCRNLWEFLGDPTDYDAKTFDRLVLIAFGLFLKWTLSLSENIFKPNYYLLYLIYQQNIFTTSEIIYRLILFTSPGFSPHLDVVWATSIWNRTSPPVCVVYATKRQRITTFWRPRRDLK